MNRFHDLRPNFFRDESMVSIILRRSVCGRAHPALLQSYVSHLDPAVENSVKTISNRSGAELNYVGCRIVKTVDRILKILAPRGLIIKSGHWSCSWYESRICYGTGYSQGAKLMIKAERSNTS